MRPLATLLVLVAAVPASATGGGLEAVEARYLPPAQAAYANTPDGAQARYDAGRDLVEAVLAVGRVGAAQRALRADLLARGRAQVARAEALDRDRGFRSAAPLAPLPGVGPRLRAAPARRGARPPAGRRRRDGERGGRDLGARARLGALRGRTRRRPASRPRPPSSSARWSRRSAPRRSPSAAAGGTTSVRSASGRRTSPRTGSSASSDTPRSPDGLRRLGMTSSTYPGPYRATTAYRPPGRTRG